MSLPNHADVLPGTWNFRDIGGTPTPAGPVRSGIVYRSAALAQLDTTGVAVLEKLGVTDVFDLRGELEIARDGKDQVPDSVLVTVAPFHPEEDEATVQEMREATTPTSRAERVIAYYTAIPGLAPAQAAVAQLLRTVADGTGSVLVHCAAGKDRTGWAIAALLTVAGADREAVLADYLLSNAAIDSLRAWMKAHYGDAFDAGREILGVDPRYLQAAWDSVEQNFGSFDGYLTAIGVDDVLVRRIRQRLVG
jgi:protein-tyrosine phosphatase